MKNILLILLENEPGSLSRVIGLFSQRGYNIDSLSVSKTQDTKISILIIQTNGNQKTIEQIEKQLHKLINVIKVNRITTDKYIERTIALIKIQQIENKIQNLQKILKIFKSKIINITNKSYIIQIYGNNKKIDNFLLILKKHANIIEIIKSGIIGINT